ncbi:CHRD domain-containing protein [Roseibacillus persicicus]|uniref:CHRD domain-containing protein n=1 Tax=Roseibacillus persicicus TaxID=454148 RepID=UPI00280C80DF|nr:CHRD domain-containing protein [Roseibacillus persicicus]MDQ8189294.1 CHRD domain-containing protein [Roseibacillus persicicus]
MKKKLSLIALIGAAGITSSHAATYILSGTIDPIQATTNASNVGSGSGTISGDYDDSTNLLNYSITWMDLTSAVTNMHFHLGAPGATGGVQLAVAGPWTSPQMGSETISETLETNLLAGNWYLNIHTSDFGGGEVRGQVEVSPVPEPSASLLALGALPILLLRRRA